MNYILPAYLAGMLITDDLSGLTNIELNDINVWINENDPGHCVSCSDERWFAWRNDMNSVGGDVCEFTFIKSSQHFKSV